jgi:hypothetical protein
MHDSMHRYAPDTRSSAEESEAINNNGESAAVSTGFWSSVARATDQDTENKSFTDIQRGRSW